MLLARQHPPRPRRWEHLLKRWAVPHPSPAGLRAPWEGGNGCGMLVGRMKNEAVPSIAACARPPSVPWGHGKSVFPSPRGRSCGMVALL